MVLLRDIHFGSGGVQVYLMKGVGGLKWEGRLSWLPGAREELPLNGRGLTN